MLSSSTCIRSLSTAAAASSKISLDLLKRLRTQTGAPIVDCKKALAATADGTTNNNNDLAAAVDWLREHGAARVSAKVAGRETAEGLVALTVSEDHRTAALVRIASETDFASRSPTLVRLIEAVAQATLADGEQQAVSSNPAVKAQLDDAIVAIRENLSIAQALQWKTTTSSSNDENGVLVGYVHNKVESASSEKNNNATAVGMSAALVEVMRADSNNSVEKEALQDVGKKLAMHIVAARPAYCTPDDVPAEEIEKERGILTKQSTADSPGKPAEIVAKIVEGRLCKFYQGVCLTEQEHMIEEGNPQIGKFLRDQGVAVKRFELVSIR